MEHAFFAELEKKGCHYCIRIKDEAAVDVIEELPVSEQDRCAGVLRQCRARLGLGKRTAQSPEIRLVYVSGVDGMILILATNLDRDQLSAADVALLYKRRWETMQWHQCGMVSDGELKTILAQQLASEQRRRESKTREAFWKRR